MFRCTLNHRRVALANPATHVALRTSHTSENVRRVLLWSLSRWLAARQSSRGIAFDEKDWSSIDTAPAICRVSTPPRHTPKKNFQGKGMRIWCVTCVSSHQHYKRLVFTLISNMIYTVNPTGIGTRVDENYHCFSSYTFLLIVRRTGYYIWTDNLLNHYSS